MIFRIYIARMIVSASVCLTLAIPVSGQTPSASDRWEVHRVGGDSLLVDPGSVQTLVYRISNHTDSFGTVRPQIDAPNSWPFTISLKSISLESGQSNLLFVTLRPPEATAVGSYMVSVRLLEENDDVVLSDAITVVTLTSRRSLGIQLQASVDYIPAGKEYTVNILVTNQSNSRERIELRALNAVSHDITLANNQIELEPFETREVVATVKTEENITAKLSNVVRMEARFMDGDPIPTSSTSRVWILPLFNNANRRSEPIPLMVSLQAVGDELGSNPQIGVRGATDALNGHLALDAQYSGADRVPMFGTRDYFRLAYSNPFGLLVLGDHVQPISPLTSSGMLGFGAGGHSSKGKFQFRGTALKTRYLFPEQTLVGGAVGYQATQRTNVSVNMISRTGLYDGEVVTARSRLLLFDKNHELDAECGLDSRSDFASPSCMLTVFGSTDRLGYRAEYVNTAESYLGPLENLQLRSVAASYGFRGGFRLFGSVRDQIRHFSEGSSRNRSDYRFGSGFGSRLGGLVLSTDVHLSFRDLDYVSAFATSDRTEQTLTSSTVLQRNSASLRATFEYGNARSTSSRYDGPVWRSRISASLSLSRRLSLTLTGEYDTGLLVNSPTTSSRSSAGAQGVWRIGRNTELSAGVLSSESIMSTRTRYQSYNALFRHKIGNGHEILFQVQRAEIVGVGNNEATDYRFSYAVPIGVPDPRRSSSVPSISGRVYDADTGIGIEGVLLFLGDVVTISGRNGEFQIPRPRYGIHYLRLDQKSIGFDRVPYIDMPIRIDSGVNAALPIDIPVVRASSVTGSISLWGIPGASGLLGSQRAAIEQIEPVGGALLELKSEQNLYRIKSDRAGIFLFKNIQAGRYELKVLRAILPDGYAIESETTHVDIGSGEEATLTLRAIPVRRTIRMIEQSALETTAANSTGTQ